MPWWLEWSILILVTGVVCSGGGALLLWIGAWAQGRRRVQVLEAVRSIVEYLMVDDGEPSSDDKE